LALPSFASAQTGYLLKGEITNGSTLFPDQFISSLPAAVYGDPPEGYPIDYVGRLRVTPDNDWRFNFTAIASDQQVTLFLAPPVEPTLTLTSDRLTIRSFIGTTFVESFDLDLNLESGVGDWSWVQDCFVCDLAYPLPSAFGTVTSVDIFAIPDGDFNDDGRWDRSDIDTLMSEIANGSTDPLLDLNSDGVLSDLDRNEWLTEAGRRNGWASGYLLGDSNLDGRVNSADLGPVGVYWQTNRSNWSDGNFTGSGVNGSDLNALALNWQKSVPSAAPVPEPSARALLLALLVMLVLCRSREVNHRERRGNRTLRLCV
jgi:hypothetical protein